MKSTASFLFLLLLIPCFSQAQETDEQNFLYLQGTLKAEKDKSTISYANIYIKGQPLGTTSNTEGKWSLTIEGHYAQDTLVLSAIGYREGTFSVDEYLRKNGKTVFLNDTVYHLVDVFITSIPAKEIISMAIRNINKNYSIKPYMLQGFCRTPFNENGKYVRLLE
ncbi:MAG TPA: hypothetical protein DDY13_05320 [Cytophagales bacterium]|jgi:hypothetical protein|nr:hypothetical protein [Cytophagales bacterium]